MGNLKSKKSKPVRITKSECLDKLYNSNQGDEIFCCSYSKWVKYYRDVCGFTDCIDYTSTRGSHRKQGVLIKPDTTGGRYFHPHFKKSTEVLILEKQSWRACIIKLPKIVLPEVNDPHWLRNPQYNQFHLENSIIAYNQGLAVLQVFTDNRYLTPKFYILDLEKRKCVGTFVMVYHSKRWYECYISPNRQKILIRPDHLTRVLVIPDNYAVRNLNTDIAYGIKLRIVAPILRAHCLTFNNKLGDDMFITACGKDIELRKTESWELIKQTSHSNLLADIHQIKCSRLGDFLCVRCVSPVHSREFTVNIIVVFSFPNLDALFSIDVNGSHWPISDVINLQVFPHFSPSEAVIAVSAMKSCSYKRKIQLHKLPLLSCSCTLKYICRRMILHLVEMENIQDLPIPAKLKDYLSFRVH